MRIKFLIVATLAIVFFIGCASETKGLLKSPCACNFNQTQLSFNLEEK